MKPSCGGYPTGNTLFLSLLSRDDEVTKYGLRQLAAVKRETHAPPEEVRRLLEWATANDEEVDSEERELDRCVLASIELELGQHDRGWVALGVQIDALDGSSHMLPVMPKRPLLDDINGQTSSRVGESWPRYSGRCGE
ncbi:MAG: hypothetical protein AAFX99_34215 [Myxococcota bacterium]